MAHLFRILLNISMFPVSLIILMITHLSGLYLRLAGIIFIIINVGELIFSGETVEVTVYENAQIIFLFYLLEFSIKFDMLKGHLQ